MNPRLRQFATALALLLAGCAAGPASAGSPATSHPAPLRRVTHPIRNRPPVLLTGASTASSIVSRGVCVQRGPGEVGTSGGSLYSVSPGVSVQKGPGEIGTGGSGSRYAVSAGVSVQKGPGESGGGGTASEYVASPGISIQKGPGEIGGGGTSAEYVASSGVSVEKLVPGSTGGGSFQFVLSRGLCVQRVPVGGSLLTTLISAGPADGATICGNTPQFTFSASSTDPSASFVFVYRVDGGAWVGPVSGPSLTLPPLSDGPHFFEVSAIDELGNEDPNPAARHFTVDTQAPTIANLAAALPTVTGATIQWTTNKPATSLVEYRISGAADWIKTTLDPSLVTAHTVTLTGLTPATTYDFRARSSDACGSETISAVQTVTTITDTPPTTTITGGPANLAVVCGSAATFTFVGSDAYTPVASLLYKYRLDGGAWSVPAISTTVTFTALADGTHTFEVAAVNQAGSADPNPAKRTFVIDTAAPVISVLSAGSVTLTSAVLTWNTDKPATTLGEYRVSGTTVWTLTTLDSTLMTAHTVSLPSLLPGKTYDFRAHSTDACGNATVSPALSFVTNADTTPPTTTITSGPAEAGFSCGLPVTFTFSGTDNYSQAATLRYKYRLDAGAWSAPSLSTTTSFTTLADGAHTFAVAAVDEAGNVDSNPATRHFTQDAAAPVVSTLASGGITATTATVTWTTDKPATSQVDYRVQGTTAWTSTTLDSTLLTAHSASLSGLTVGTIYEYRAHSADGCGHETISAIQTLSTGLDTVPPTTSITGGPADGSTSCSATMTLTYTGSDNVTPVSALRYETSLDGAAFSAPSNSATITLSNLADGPHTFTVKAVDQSGNVDPTGATVHFIVAAHAPVLTAVTAIPRDVRATMTWTTDKAASSQVEYGLTTAYGSLTTPDVNTVTAHSETIAGLTPLTTYHYRAHSKDTCQESISADQTFTTSVVLVPNLSVTSLTFPNSVTTQTPVTFSWAVMDSGPGDAIGAWTDSIYLSPTNTLNLATATLLGAYPAPTALQMGGQYTQSQSVSLPNVTPGNYYVIIVTNSGSTITETTTADNALAMPLVVLRNQTLIASPDQIPLTLRVNAPQFVTLSLNNLSSVLVTGLTATVTGATPNIQVQVTPPSTLASLTGSTAQVKVTATNDSVISDTAVVHLTDQQGDTADATLNLTVVPNKPNLVASPSPLSQGMTRGETTLAFVTLTNTGAATATGLIIRVPNAPWVSLAVPAAVGDLAPGASVQIVLRLTPDVTLPLGQYSGTIAINGSNIGLSIPFAFNNVSSGVGALKVIAQDEYSFNAPTHPNLPGAHVIVTDVTTNAVVVDGVTGSDGILSVPSVPEGNYNVAVTADGHADYHGTLALVVGETNEIDTFLSRNDFVKTTWNVVPVDTLDGYEISIDTTFQTNVPAPVITIAPTLLDLGKVQFDSQGEAFVKYTITNHGLIAADNLTFNFPDSPTYHLTPAITNFGRVAALSSVEVLVTIRKGLNPSNALVSSSNLAMKNVPSGASDVSSCVLAGLYAYDYYCGADQHKFGTTAVLLGCSLAALIPALPPLFGELPPATGPGGGTPPSPYGPNIPLNPITSPTPTVTTLDFCDDCVKKRLAAIGLCGLSFVPGLSCGVSAFSSTLQCGTSIYLDSQDAGKATLTYQTATGCLLGYTDTFVGCAGDASEVVAPPLGIGLKIAGCGVGIGSACSSGTPIPLVDNLIVVANRLKAFMQPYVVIFGDQIWFEASLADNAVLTKFVAAFRSYADPKNGNGSYITSIQKANLLALPLPSQLTPADAAKLIERWNRSQDYYRAMIFAVADVPVGQSKDFIPLNDLQSASQGAVKAISQDTADGYNNPFSAVQQAAQDLKDSILHPNAGVCAQVRIRLNQDIAISRTAFSATLNVINSTTNTTLENLKVTLKITDEAQNNVSSLFAIAAPKLGGVNAIDGTGEIAMGKTASVQWNILPTRAAAANGPTTYYVSGEVSFNQNGTQITLPLFPTGITVVPDPYLNFHYFLQRDVYSDDPFTPQIEPSEPFSLGLLVNNAGQGTARNLTITASQPKIIDNQKGLDVAFQIIGTQVNTTPTLPSLKVNMGSIAPGGTAVADFLLTASLSGQFVSDIATFRHGDDLGNAQTSLIDSVDTHSLEHVVRVVDPMDDGKPDFLVDDIPDLNNLPDTLWNSDGTTSPVTALTDAAFDGPVTNANLIVHLTVPTTPSGFVYIRADDAGQGLYQLTSVVRSDGKVIALGDNAWTTHRIIHLQGQAPTPQNRVYLFDDNTTGAYTLTYAPFVPIKPSVILTSPQDGDTFSPSATVAIVATASSPQAIVKELDFYADGALINASLTAPFSVSYQPSIGSHILKAVAIDTNGTASDPVQISIRVNPLTNQPPVIQLTAPQDGGNVIAPATVTLSAIASDSDGTIAKVDFYNNGNFFGSSIVPPYVTTLQNLVSGSYYFTAIAIDNQGATTLSNSLSITVQPQLTNTGLPLLRAVSAVRQANPGQILITLQNMGGMDAVNVALAATRIKWGGQAPISITPTSVSMLAPNSTTTFMVQFPSTATGPIINLFGTYSGRSFNSFTPVTP